MVAPPTIVTAPPTTPPRHGLQTTAAVHPHQAGDPEDRWELGFGFLPETCSEPETWVLQCVGPAGTAGPGADATPGSEPGYPAGYLGFTPYQIQAWFECDTQSRRAVDVRDRATRIVEAGTSKAMEYELWEGRTAGVAALGAGVGNLQLTDSNTFTDSGPISATATTPRLGLVSLVQAAARSVSGQRAMIHGTPATVMAWWQSGSLKEEGGRLVTTVGGHLVVAGSGYTGSGPDNVADADPDVHWAWITSPVYWMLGEILVNPPGVDDNDPLNAGIDFRENDKGVTAHRTAVAFWDGCLHTGLPINTMGSLQ